jgi:hypothetical protein
LTTGSNNGSESGGAAVVAVPRAGKGALQVKRLVTKRYDPELMSPYDDVSEELAVEANEVITTIGAPGGYGTQHPSIPSLHHSITLSKVEISELIPTWEQGSALIFRQILLCSRPAIGMHACC